jgi:hypothetical protein
MRVLFVALFLVLITPLICSAQAPNQLVTLSSNGKYLVNSITNQPVFLTGEDAFALSVQLSNADVTTYLTDRSSRGYNAVWMAAIDQVDQVGAPKDFAGNAPFDGAWFTNPDAAYWAQQDAVIQQASAKGITIFLGVSFVGLNTSEGYDLAAILASSDATMTAYGAFLGNRYKGYNNIVYVLGGDADPSFSGLYSKIADIANGIKSVDSNHLITLEACRVCSPANQSTINAYGGNPPSFMNLNWVYNTEATVVAGCQAGFASANSSIPPLMGEDWYELEHSVTGFLARQEGYWETLSGCYLGRLFGNGAIWPFNSPNDGVTSPTWQSQLSSAGSVGQQFLGQLMRSREHWLMAPDTNHSVLTAGFGSGSTLSVAARSSDGQTIIAYFSDGDATAKTINMAEIVSASSTTNAWWYNPQTGAATLIGSFPNSGSQSFTAPDGNDWVLVIDDASANLGAPGGGTANNPAPAITSLSPSTIAAGGQAFTLTVNGSGFISSSTVDFNGAAKATTFVSATKLTAAILASDIATSGNAIVTVTNPAPGGGTTANFVFVISSSANPAPTLSSISPTSATAGSGSFTLTANGTGFVSGSTVNFGGNGAITPTSITSTQIVATIPAADIATAGPANVTVTNPAPGGGTSGAQVFTINSANNPTPTLSSISPTSAVANSGAFTLTVNGNNFVSGSTVNFNGGARSTTFVSSTKVTAAILASDIATAGSVNVTVTNPAPGGGTSGAQTFAINNPAPTVASISPASVTAGGAAFTLTVNGTNFVSTSVVNFNGVAKTTTFKSASQVTAAIAAADIATAGAINVTVTNPAPGGGTSSITQFTVNNSIVGITSLSPASAVANSGAFTLTVNGNNFVSGSTVNFNGGARITTFVNSTKVTAGILATDIAATGNFPVTVTNPAPGGGTSTAVNFAVTNPPPTVSTISPTSATAGGGSFTLTVNGTGFVSGATVKFGGNGAITPTSTTSTQIVATIPAADIVTAGTESVTVTNPAPGGGTSGAQTFTINNPAPTLSSIAPTSATAGGAAFTLTVNGAGFVASSVVKFNSVAKTTTFKSASQLTAAITAADIATAGTAAVTVTNSAPGGGTSSSTQFTIDNSAVAISSVSPTSAMAGGAGFTLTVNGSGFVAASTVKFNGVAKTTTFKSATQLSAAITAADIASAEVTNVTVTNPAPGGGTSNAASFTINNASPTLSSLSPSSANEGGAAFTLTVNGSGFVNGATVQFKGANRTTTFVSSSKVTAAILATDIASAGTATVTVTNPTPTTGPSSPGQNFAVNAAGNLVPDVTELGPAHIPGGTAFTLTLSGTNFLSGSVVNFNGKAEATKFISATSLSATIPAADLATAGSVSVTVTNPAPGGTSAAMTFIVDGYSVSGPSAATVTPAQPATIQIGVTPTANGFANLVSFSVTGLPANVTASFNPKTITPNGKAVSAVLTLTSAASAAAKPSSSTGMPAWKLSPVTLGLWLMILLGGAYAGIEIRKTPRLRTHSAIVTISLVVLMGLLQGCATTGSSATSPGTSQLTISATSGTLTRTIEVTLTSTQ